MYFIPIRRYLDKRIIFGILTFSNSKLVIEKDWIAQTEKGFRKQRSRRIQGRLLSVSNCRALVQAAPLASARGLMEHRLQAAV